MYDDDQQPSSASHTIAITVSILVHLVILGILAYFNFFFYP